MICFLPVARYRVEYQVASGRPFSTFERLVLAAINDGNNTLNELAAIFAVHRRLIVEAVVTLMQAGWVSLGAKSHEFAVTAAGKVACGEQKQLPPTIVLDRRVTSIVVEKVTGQIARNNEVDFYPKAKLRKLWSSGVSIPKGDISNRIDPGMVAPLLQHDSTEWVRSIEMPYVISDNTAYIVVEVDTLNSRVMGLPEAWEPILAPEMLDRAQKRERDLVKNPTIINDRELKALVKLSQSAESDQVSDQLDPWSRISIGKADVLSKARSHLETLEYFLINATSYVGIASSFLVNSSVQKLLPLFEGALRRDLLITLVWGRHNPDSGEHRAAFEALKKLAYDSSKSASLGRLVVSNAPSGSSANILLADLPSGIEAVLGSYSWTASSTTEAEKHFSLRLRNPKLVARLCEILRDLSSTDEKLRISSGIVRLEKGAEELRAASQRTVTQNETARARLILDLEHKTIFRDTISRAKRSIDIYSAELNLGSSTGWWQQLTSTTTLPADQMRARYGHDASPEPTLSRLQGLLKHGVSLLELPRLQSNLLVIDNQLLVSSSYPWLADPLPSRRPYAVDIGIALRGEAIDNLISLDNFIGDKAP
jgi:hypothetical protein